jgi:hypothetical protein
MGLEKWADLAPKKEFKRSEESARAELSRLMTWYEVDIEETTPDQEVAVEQILNRLLNAIRMGKLQSREETEKEKEGLSVIQHLKSGDKLTYRELKGADKTRLESAGNDPTKRMHTLAGLLTGYGADAIGKLPSGDLRVCEGLMGYFLVLT